MNKQEHVFINSSFTDVFESVNSIHVINKYNTLHNVQPEIHECIIMKESSYESNDITRIDNSLTFNGKEYELRLMVNTTHINTSTYNVQIYSQDGGRYKKLWYQERINSKISYPIQIDSDPIPNDQGDVIRIYVRHGGISMADISKQLLHYIGGQTHIICKNHRLPLIPVPDRIAKCKCGKKEHIPCPHLDCTACIYQI